MRSLLLMRHAKSSWKDSSLDDFDRPLKRRGLRAAQSMAQLLVTENLVPELIVCSAAERARQTVDQMLPFFGVAPAVEFRDDLYMALPTQYIKTIREVDDSIERLLIIGHNPGLEELIFEWSAEFQHFPTAAIAHYELNLARWDHIRERSDYRYQHLWSPKEIAPRDDH